MVLLSNSEVRLLPPILMKYIRITVFRLDVEILHAENVSPSKALKCGTTGPQSKNSSSQVVGVLLSIYPAREIKINMGSTVLKINMGSTVLIAS